MCEIDFAGDPNDWFLEEDADDDNEPSFVVLEKEELEERQTNIIESVGMQLNIAPADAALVLQYFNWDTDNLLGTYFDNPEFYLYKAGLVSPHNPFPLSKSSNPTMTCPVCLEETPRTDMFTLGCSHSYCLDCWRRYLHEITESSGPEIVNASCIDPKCIVKLNFLDFERLACTEDYNRYHYFFLKRFAESDPHIVYCPNPSCGNAVLYQGDGHPTDVVECHCGTRFCFSCGLEKHNPVTCEQLKMWLDLLRDDSESMSVIKSTSKQCFHCGVPTERITGCNHMVCRKEMGGCGGEWCWMCRGDWKTHGAHTGGFYSCNKYENSDAKKIDEDSQSYLQSSQRLMHYFNRYFNHDVLMKNMQKQLSDGGVEQKMDHFMGITSCCPDFYMEAAELLVECRRMLKYTYVYGYYLEEGPGRALFEYQQASAEGVTERLSDMFHSSVENIAQSPLEFVNYIRVAKKHINNLIKSIEAGFTLESVQSFEN